MAIERNKPPRPCFVKYLITTQLMIDSGQHSSKCLGRDQTKDVPDSVGAWLLRAHKALQSLGHAKV